MNKTATIYSKAEAKAMAPKDRPICFRVTSKIYNAAFEAAGHASVCWSPKPGKECVFDSDEASKAALAFCFAVAEELERLGVSFERVNEYKPD